jgi:hypothetical protein
LLEREREMDMKTVSGFRSLVASAPDGVARVKNRSH